MQPMFYPEPGIDHSIFNLNGIWLYVDLKCEQCGKHQGAPNYFENSSKCIQCGFHDKKISALLQKFGKIESLANKLTKLNYDDFSVINIRTQISFTHLIAYADEYITKLEYLVLREV